MKALAGRFYKYILKHNNNRYCVVDMFISRLGEREGWDWYSAFCGIFRHVLSMIIDSFVIYILHEHSEQKRKKKRAAIFRVSYTRQWIIK